MNNDMPRINRYWVRHGYSCANYTRDNENAWYNPFAHTRVPDPRLHIVGKEQAQQLSEIFNRNKETIDLVCSSQLLRSIETAQTLYNRLDSVSENKIMILPQICEEGNTNDNIPYRYINNIVPSYTTQLENLDYTKYYPSYEYFLKKVLISLTNYLISKVGKKSEYNIIIVSHSHFLKTIFGIKLNNCQYILERNALYNYKEIIELCKTMKFKYAKEKVFEKNKNNYIFNGPIFHTIASIKETGGCKDYDQDLVKINRYIYGFKSKTKKSKTKKSKSKKSKSKKSKSKKSKSKY